MVARLQSEKGSFVQSPLKAFDTDFVPDPCAIFTATLTLTDQGVGTFWALLSLPCNWGFSLAGPPGYGQEWLIHVEETGNLALRAERVLGFTFAQGPNVLSLPAYRAIANSACKAPSGLIHNYGGHGEVVGGGATLWQNVLSYEEGSQPAITGVDIRLWRIIDRPGFDTESNFVTGPMTVTDCPQEVIGILMGIPFQTSLIDPEEGFVVVWQIDVAGTSQSPPRYDKTEMAPPIVGPPWPRITALYRVKTPTDAIFNGFVAFEDTISPPQQQKFNNDMWAIANDYNGSVNTFDLRLWIRDSVYNPGDWHQGPGPSAFHEVSMGTGAY